MSSCIATWMEITFSSKDAYWQALPLQILQKRKMCCVLRTRKKGSQARGRAQRLHRFVRNVFCVLAIAFEVSHTCSKCCYSYCRKPLTYWCEVIGFGQCYLACKCWYYWIERTETKFAHVLKLFNVLCNEGLLTKVTQRWWIYWVWETDCVSGERKGLLLDCSAGAKENRKEGGRADWGKAG